MIHLAMVQRGVLRLLVPVLFAVTAVFAVAAPASAAPAWCTGFITNSIESDPDTLVGYIRSNGARGVVDRGLSDVGTQSVPINRFIIRSGTVAVYIDYTDIRTGADLGTHGPIYPGTYQVNPCHRAVIRVVWVRARLSVDDQPAAQPAQPALQM